MFIETQKGELVNLNHTKAIIHEIYENSFGEAAHRVVAIHDWDTEVGHVFSPLFTGTEEQCEAVLAETKQMLRSHNLYVGGV